MKKKYFYLLAIPLLLGVFLFLFYTIYNKQSEKKQKSSKYNLSKQEFSLIHDGDIILRHGYGFVSDFIVESFNSQIGVSHCAIITKDTCNKWIVIHSVSQSLSDFDGVQSQPLDTFIRDCQKNSIVILRYKSNDSTKYIEIGNRAKYYLNQKIPFDNRFDINDSTEFFCTELLWKVFKDVYQDDIMVNKANNELYDPKKFDSLLDTTRFSIILNHHNNKQ